MDENRARLERLIGAPVLFVQQVHSPDVAVISRGDRDPLGAPVRTADALVTDRDDLALGIMVADCLPVLLSDDEAGVIGAAHAGRAGLLADVLGRTVTAMCELGAQAGRIRAVIGPSVCGACYEVPADMAAEAERLLSGCGSRTSWGTPAIDLRAGAVVSLGRAGVPAGQVESAAPCTVEDERYFSYRRSARTGRLAGVIRRV